MGSFGRVMRVIMVAIIAENILHNLHQWATGTCLLFESDCNYVSKPVSPVQSMYSLNVCSRKRLSFSLRCFGLIFFLKLLSP